MVNILPPSKNISSQIGSALGLGLGNKINQYQNNQQLQQILQKAYPQNGASGSEASSQSQQAGPQLSPEQILLISQKNPQLGKMLQDQQFQAQKMQHKEKEFDFKEKKLLLDETKDYRNSLQTQAQSADELGPVLNQMENLINSGKLTNPVIAKLADKAGLVGLLDPTSQQYQGLAVGFLKDAKNIFGSRVTNFDLETYIDKIPRLTQTDKGKRVLIDNFRVLGEASQVRNRIKNQIIRENKGTPPFDLQEQVEERAGPLLDKVAEKFNKNIYKSSQGSPGKILMRSASGQLGEVPEEKVKDAMAKGYTLG